MQLFLEDLTVKRSETECTWFEMIHFDIAACVGRTYNDLDLKVPKNN